MLVLVKIFPKRGIKILWAYVFARKLIDDSLLKLTLHTCFCKCPILPASITVVLWFDLFHEAPFYRRKRPASYYMFYSSFPLVDINLQVESHTWLGVQVPRREETTKIRICIMNFKQVSARRTMKSSGVSDVASLLLSPIYPTPFLNFIGSSSKCSSVILFIEKHHRRWLPTQEICHKVIYLRLGASP